MELKCADTSGPLIDLFFSVYKSLGYGFLERVYSNAMVMAGRKVGLEIKQDAPIRVSFEGCII
jgi:GxxExxY protein